MSDFFKSLFGAFVGSVLAAVATITTGAFGYLNKDREQDIQMVNIALSILSGPNKDDALEGRKFALNMLERYSLVNIDPIDKEKWSESGTLPENIFKPISGLDGRYGGISSSIGNLVDQQRAFEQLWSGAASSALKHDLQNMLTSPHRLSSPLPLQPPEPLKSPE